MAFRKEQRVTADIVPMPMEIPEDDDQDLFIQPVANLKRNLLGEFSRPSIIELPEKHEHMNVYLRIRPFSDSELEKNENQDCLSVLNDNTVSTNPPKDSHFFKNMSRNSCKTVTRYTFSHIFNDETTQKDFFSSTMLGLVKDFIDGQNCLVFSYGVTSSGKTYTIQGNPRDAGVLPRALDVIFNSIGKRQWEGMDLKPNMFMDVTRLSPDQELKETKIKEQVLKLSCESDMDVMSLLGDDTSDISLATNTTTSSESSNMSHIDGKDSIDTTDLFDELATRVREEGTVSIDEQGQVRFSVWVSFAEIYNEQIYDLLEPMPKKKNTRRPCLKLSEDKSGSPYIKGLKHIQVSSADEAYKLLTIGQRNLQKACTKLNHNSSRSHCIFNIKILRVMDKDNPHVARVSMLTLCDLAGSERYGKTKASGERLKEAGNINTSLLTLGRCIETLRYNQAHKDNAKIVPFRESKLTRLFQNFFVGRGKAAMIVNVNQLASMFDETMHVFKFSALASKVEVHQKPVFIRPKLPVKSTPVTLARSSISWATPARNSSMKQSIAIAQNAPLPGIDDEDDDLEDTADDSAEEEPQYTQENIDELVGIIEQLQADLENEIHTKFKMEKQIRKEVCDEMMKQFSEIEEEYSERIKLREQRAEELAEKRIQLVLKSERARKEYMTDDDDEWVSSVLLHQEKVKVEQKEEKIQELQQEIEDLKSKIDSLEEQNDSHLTDTNEKVTDYEDRLKTLEENLKQETEKSSKLDELTKQMTDYEETIKTLEMKVTQETEMSSKLDEMTKQMRDYEEKIKSLEMEITKKQQELEESNKADLVENLTQQLQQTREQMKDQEKEVSELNDMLTEAGETFEAKQSEIEKLKELTQEYEKRMEEQAEAIKVLERAATDSKVAIETADVSLSKREECVSTLQKDIRDLEAEVNKYKNKARFFEDQIVEKESEASQWKNKYERDIDDHAKSQEALIHGFNAEISNLKSQIFNFKTQLYGVKSPVKSPGGTLRTPEAKMKLFPMSPLSTPNKNDSLNCSSGSHSPAKESRKHNVDEQVKALQGEMDKNCKMISELEHALQLSRACAEDQEKRLMAESDKCKQLQEQLQSAEELSKKCTCLKSGPANENVVIEKMSLEKSEAGDLDERLKKKDLEIQGLNDKVKELEPLMKDYFSTAKKLTDSEKQVKELQNLLEENAGRVSEYENKIKGMEGDITQLKKQLSEKDESYSKLEEKFEEIEMLNTELKNVVDKTAFDLLAKDSELQILSPKLEKLKHIAEDEHHTVESLQSKLDLKVKENKDLKDNLSKLKLAFKMNKKSLEEITEKCSQHEFNCEELEITNQDLQQKAKENEITIEDLKNKLEKNMSEVKGTGEELALVTVDAEKYKRVIEELKVNISDLESAVADKEVELCEKDKVIADKDDEIYKMKATNDKVDGEKSESDQHMEQLQSENKTLKNELKELNTKLTDVEKEYESISDQLEEKQKSLDEMTNLKEQMNDLQRDNERLVKELLEIKIRFADVEKEYIACSKEMSEKQKSLDEMTSQKDILEENLRKLQNDDDKLNGELLELKTKFENVEKEYLGHCREMEEKQKNIDELTSHKENLEETSDKLQHQNTEISSQKENLEKDLKEIQAEHVSIKEKLVSNDNAGSKLLLLESELRNKSEELHCAEKIVGEIKEVLKRRDEQLEELHGDLRNSHKNSEQSSREIAKKDEQILILQVSIVEKAKTIDGLHSQIAKTNKLLAEKEADLMSVNEEMQSKNSALKKHEIESEHALIVENMTQQLQVISKENELLKQDLEETKLLNSQNEKELCDLREKLTENDALRKEAEESQVIKEELEKKLSVVDMKVRELNKTNKDLKQKLDDMSESHEDNGVKSEVEKLTKENKNLENEITSWKEAADRRDTALQEQIEKLNKIEQRNKELEQEIVDAKNSKNNKVENEDDSDLKSELCLKEVECETLKLELKVLKEQLNDSNETSCLSPQTGVRKLRKAKIEIENDLIEARYKISSHESKIKELEIKLLNAKNSQECAPVNDELIQQKLNTVTSKLEETETMNMSLLKEVSQLESLVNKLETELKEEQDRAVPVEREIHRRSRASMLQADLRLSIGSPCSKMELTKSQEREQTLKEQLKKADSMIQDWLAKLNESENKLSVKTQELKHARETIEALEAKMTESGCKIDQQLQEYMERNNDLKLQILKKEGEIECNTRTIQNLQRQLETESEHVRSMEKDKASQDQFVSTLKEMLEDQETMLQEQADYIEEKETALQTSQSDHQELLEKYKLLVEKQDTSQENESCGERNILKQQLTEANTDKMKLLKDLKEKTSHLSDVERKLKHAVEERDKLTSVIKENNQELKAMECSLTESMKQIEELKSQGSDKCADIKLEEIKREHEKTTHDLQAKIRNLQCQKKELEFKLNAHIEKVNGLNEEKHCMEQKLQEFRVERDKLVSGLEAVLKKKDTEIKQHKDMIKQLKEKEIQLSKSWHEERQQIAAGLQDLNENAFTVKTEKSPSSSIKEEPLYAEVDSSSNFKSPVRSCSRPPRPSPPKIRNTDDQQQSDLKIKTLNQSPGTSRRESRTIEETPTPVKTSRNSGSSKGRRRGKKRPSDEGLDSLPPKPKRQSKDRTSNVSVSESDDYSSHLQVDATPPVAAKTLRRTRKKNGSQLDLSKTDDSENQPSSTRRSSRNKRSRLLESFRESPMAKTGKRLLDSIAETFSPKSPTRSPVRSPLREDNSGLQSGCKDVGSTEHLSGDTESHEKKSGRSRARHKLYKEDTYISEPFESSAGFVQNQDETIHRTVTRSLRSRRH